jgi:hypothetical protein
MTKITMFMQKGRTVTYMSWFLFAFQTVSRLSCSVWIVWQIVPLDNALSNITDCNLVS